MCIKGQNQPVQTRKGFNVGKRTFYVLFTFIGIRIVWTVGIFCTKKSKKMLIICSSNVVSREYRNFV